MSYGICDLGIVPMRSEASVKSELVNQLLYGDIFKVTEKRKKWSKIRLEHDKSEGYIDNNQFKEIPKDTFKELKNKPLVLSTNTCDYINDADNRLLTIPLGSNVNLCSTMQHTFEGEATTPVKSKGKLVETAYLFLNAPYLWGGRTPFGIDSSGFTQMVYRLNGISLFRDAAGQASQGEVLSFIEESQPGDLAFFDDNEGAITHVGIILEHHHIIHAYGKVRIDRLDQSGIYNQERNEHTHKLRVIKKII